MLDEVAGMNVQPCALNRSGKQALRVATKEDSSHHKEQDKGRRTTACHDERQTAAAKLVAQWKSGWECLTGFKTGRIVIVKSRLRHFYDGSAIARARAHMKLDKKLDREPGRSHANVRMDVAAAAPMKTLGEYDLIGSLCLIYVVQALP